MEISSKTLLCYSRKCVRPRTVHQYTYVWLCTFPNESDQSPPPPIYTLTPSAPPPAAEGRNREGGQLSPVRNRTTSWKVRVSSSMETAECYTMGLCKPENTTECYAVGLCCPEKEDGAVGFPCHRPLLPWVCLFARNCLCYAYMLRQESETSSRTHSLWRPLKAFITTNLFAVSLFCLQLKCFVCSGAVSHALCSGVKSV